MSGDVSINLLEIRRIGDEICPTPTFPHGSTRYLLRQTPLLFLLGKYYFLVLHLGPTTFANFRACCSGPDDNSLNELQPHGILPRLRILRLSANRLKCLDSSHFPNLRVLYIDNNSLTEFKKANKLRSLENLSLRNQGGNAL